MPVIPATWDTEDHKFKASLGKVSEPVSQKPTKNKRAGGKSQVTEYLLNRPTILDPIPSNTHTYIHTYIHTHTHTHPKTKRQKHARVKKKMK
jgi:hypothetical protein